VIDELAKVLPRAQRVMIQGANHAPNSTHPKEYVEILKSFLGGL
jgi:pimeloyl-ACP methyl ester carboxylesterase